MTNRLLAGTDCKIDAGDNVKKMFTRHPTSASDIGLAVCALDVEMEALEKQQAALSVKYAVLRKALKRLDVL